MFGPFEYLIFWITTLYIYKYFLNFILDSSEKNFKQTKKKILLKKKQRSFSKLIIYNLFIYFRL